MVNKIAQIVLIGTDDHAGKTVMNTGSRSSLKGRDPLPVWLKECGKKMEAVDKNTAEELM